MTGDDFIEAWYARTRTALVDALEYAGSLDTIPVPDGVFGDWIETVCALRFSAEDGPPIACLIGKPDPHLQEAGVRLAHAALRTADVCDAIEPALARLVSRPIDPWVLEALVPILSHSGLPLTPVYEALATIHGQAPRGHGILRNRAIWPWRRVVEVYQQHAIQTLRPQPRDLAYLPVLERALGTRGWDATARLILVKMGFDPDEHYARLRGR